MFVMKDIIISMAVVINVQTIVKYVRTIWNALLVKMIITKLEINAFVHIIT